MDLSAKISLALSIVELLIASWAYFKFERTRLSRLVVNLLILLGLTHFFEYQFCSFGNFNLWGKISFIAYILIPSLVLYYACQEVLNKKIIWLFIPYLGFTLTALILKRFSILGECHFGLSLVYNYFFFGAKSLWPSILNFSYIALYSCISSGLLFYGSKKIFNEKRKIYLYIGSSIFLSFTVSTLLVVIKPNLGMYYPSIINHFLASYLFTGIASLYLEKKIIDQAKQKNPGY